MMLSLTYYLPTLLITLSSLLLPASIVRAQSPSSTSSAASALNTICGDIIQVVEEDVSNNFFAASDAYNCLTSVPLNVPVALRFIEYYNTTLEFQSTLAYLKNPTPEYQQPAVDVLQALNDIKQNLTAGYYQNEYDFEATLQTLVQRIHDYHVVLNNGILQAFTFGSPYDIMSVSVDGKQLPQPYFADDIINMQSYNFTPSPITTINGQDAIPYLTQFAAQNANGMLDPNSDWNNLMYTPVQDILGTYDTFGWEVTLYPGDTLNFTFANGSTVDTIWLAIYQNFYRTGPLTTGGDFYNYFALGLLPASFTGPETRGGYDNFTAQPAATSWYNLSTAYPAYADIVQPDLSLAGGGFLTGYFLNASSTAVLSIPSFQEYGDAIGTFSNTTVAFIQGAQDAGLKRVVIDLQQNTGGEALLAFDTFTQFFPPIQAYAGSNRRSFLLANALGAATTDFWDSLSPNDTTYDYSIYHDDLAADEWIITDRINAEINQTFTSWEQFQGPRYIHGDTFSLVERYNLSDQVFDAAAFNGFAPGGYGQDLASIPPPWAPENIVILTDGACSSTCALFVEMMTHQAGVRTVVVGGAPRTGPMQAVAGSRGAIAYSADILDSDFEFASAVNTTASTILPQNRDPGLSTSYAGFNLRNQLRKNDTTPLQFQYEAADCRIWYTFANAYNLTRLWLDAASAMFDNPSLCVQGSTGYASSNGSTPNYPLPATNTTNSTRLPGVQTINATKLVDETGGNVGLEDARLTVSFDEFTLCNSRCGVCSNVTCSGSDKTVSLCPLACSQAYTPCGSGLGQCVPFARVERKDVSVSGQSFGSKSLASLYCKPKANAAFNGCPNVNTGDTPGGGV